MWEEISAHIYKHLKIASKRPGEMVYLFVHPYVAILSIGIFAYFLITKGAPLESMIFAFVGVVMWNFYDAVQRAMSFGITLDVWNECLKHTFAGKSRARHFILGNAIYGLCGALVGLVLVGTAGILAFGFNVFGGGAFLALNLLSIFLFASGIGLLINSLMVTRGEKYMALLWMMTGVIMVFSGVYYPPEVLPPLVQQAAMALPSTHALASLRAALFGGAPGTATIEFLVGLGLAAVLFLVGALVFKFAVRKGRENGMIIKY